METYFAPQNHSYTLGICLFQSFIEIILSFSLIHSLRVILNVTIQNYLYVTTVLYVEIIPFRLQTSALMLIDWVNLAFTLTFTQDDMGAKLKTLSKFSKLSNDLPYSETTRNCFMPRACTLPYTNIFHADFGDPVAHILLHWWFNPAFLLPTKLSPKLTFSTGLPMETDQEPNSENSSPLLKLKKSVETTNTCSLFPPKIVSPVTKYKQWRRNTTLHK